MNKSTQLKPCPFCGGEAYLSYNIADKLWSVSCKECLSSDERKHLKAGDCTKEQMVEHWNTRHEGCTP